MHPSLFIFTILAVVTLPANLPAQSSEALLAPTTAPLEKRFELVMPSASEDAWRSVAWRTNLMEAREIAQKQNRPLFLWIMVGNPHGCT